MSNTDSFIEEVTEEVRNDRLFATLKRWGWVGGLAILVVVGGAGYNEWRKSTQRASAEAFGDAFIAAFEAEDQTAAFEAIPTDSPEQAALAGLMSGADALSRGEREAGLAALDQVAAVPDAPEIYKQLAALKRAMALGEDTSPEDRIAAFEALAAPGAPFAVLAQEQKALVMIETGDHEGAIALLKSLLDQAAATPGLQRRASELIVALGGDVSGS